jgi:hypothetical protein
MADITADMESAVEQSAAIAEDLKGDTRQPRSPEERTAP